MNARPRIRAECIDGPRPCPWVSCRHNLALDVTLTVARKRSPARNHDAADDLVLAWLWSGRPTCALDVADAGQRSQSEIAKIMSLTRQRVSQIEIRAVARAAASHPRREEP